ncbi:MAG: cofactor-independent phosphoglycerate mutase [Marinilabiliales bacterium]|nr:MAG: cofactor-independent phosphoglycerate mutase [Marinilabiliales bacterium]
MKYIIILGDGMADYPIETLGNKTPLMAANTPNIDKLCKLGKCGKLVTVPDDMPPGSEIANMAVLGYDVKKVYQGRGVLEAASMGIDLDPDDLAMRCNIICIENEKIKNHSAGHISNEEAEIIIRDLKKEIETDKIKLYQGVSYRHLLVIKGGINDIQCTPPHDVPGTAYKNVLVKAKNSKSDTADLLNKLILKSQEFLKKHPVNLKRQSEGKDPANSIWPWSPGHKPEMKTLQEQYGINGAVISAVDLLYGIGKYAGMKGIKVPESTGLYDTNYEGKAKAAVEALKDSDLVYLHIEASDEAGHEGNIELKTKTIEYLDSRVVKYVMEETAKMQEPVSIALLPDHPTPCVLKTHTHDPVPFIIYNPEEEGDKVQEYNEESTKEGHFGIIKGDEFIKALLKK